MNIVRAEERKRQSRDGAARPIGGYMLPISKLHAVPYRARLALKVYRITTCEQLLTAAGDPAARARLAAAAQIEPAILELLVHRADMARVHGVGVVFGLMLEDLGVDRVSSLAGRDPVELHQRLRQFNQAQRRSRRSPTPEEVAAWVAQARDLPVLVT